MGYCTKHDLPCKFADDYGCISTDGCWKEYKDEKHDFCMKNCKGYQESKVCYFSECEKYKEHMKKKESNEGSKD